MPAYEEIFPFIYHIPLRYTHVYLVAEEDGLTLVDSGLKGNDKKILQAVSELGRKPADVKTVLITHHHSDHVGSLAAVLKRSGATAWVHPLDAPIVAGTQKRPPPNPASIAGKILGPLISRLPQNNPPPAKAGHEVIDGDTVPVAGGVQAIHTPGHTAGHMSYLMPGHGNVLFVGDAAAHGFGRLGKPLLIFTEDRDEVKTSMRKLARLEFDTACFGHGGVVKGKAHAEFKRYVEKLAKERVWYDSLAHQTQHRTREDALIRVSVMYPNTEGKRFDHDYYAQKHCTMIAEKCGDAMVKYEIDKGIAGMPPGQPAPFIAAVHMFFNDIGAFQGAFAPHAAAIMGDVPNYTDLMPTIQISEVIA